MLSSVFGSSDSIVFKVGNNPDPVSPVRRTDGDSWNNKRLDFVTTGFQVSAHCFEYQAVVPSNKPTHVFSDDPVRWCISYNLIHVRPLVAVVCRSLSSSGVAEWLAGETAGDNGKAAISSRSLYRASAPGLISITPPSPSDAAGVRNKLFIWVARFGIVVPLGYFSIRFLNFAKSIRFSLAVGVSNKLGNVTVELAVWPVLSEYGGREWLPLAENMSNCCIVKYLL